MTTHVELSNLVGKIFYKTHFGAAKKAELLEVKKDQVKLREPGRKDSFTIPINKFNKFYKLVN